jgi:RNA polymerase sigma factor (TIGR02999 family)
MAVVPADITALLRDWEGGDRDAFDRLVPFVYDELRRAARNYMRHEGAGNSLQTTALVNEAYVRLVDLTSVRWQDRAHFFAVAASMMRRILLDAARARLAGKRGGGALRITLHEDLVASSEASHLVAVDEAIEALAKIDPRKAQVVEMRFFGGLSVDEMAQVLKISPQTVKRDWRLARAWLLKELRGPAAV